MKQDRLEEFVRKNRAEFGPGEDAPDLFSRIKKPEAPEPQISISWRRVLARAASVIAIFVASYYFHDYMSSNNVTREKTLSKETLSSPLYRELLEADEYYTAQISARKAELFSSAANEQGLQTDVTNELAALDEQMIDLKNDLNDDANNQEVVEAMIDNYRLKLELLEDMLEQIKSKKDKENRDESSYSI